MKFSYDENRRTQVILLDVGIYIIDEFGLNCIITTKTVFSPVSNFS